MRETIAAFLVPVLTTVLLLHKVLAHLQIAVLNGATLLVVGLCLLVAVGVGLIAAVGPYLLRVIVLSACAFVLIDSLLPLRTALEKLGGQ